jgi:Group II intron, maturase-specific domain
MDYQWLNQLLRVLLQVSSLPDPTAHRPDIGAMGASEVQISTEPPAASAAMAYTHSSAIAVCALAAATRIRLNNVSRSGAVTKRLREEFGKLQVEINDQRSRTVDLERSGSFGFLGFDFRYLRSLRGAIRPHYTLKLKKRTALMRELKEAFRRHRSQPIGRMISLINPMLRGWVNYFAVGHSGACFGYSKDWVEKKVRRALAGAWKQRASAGSDEPWLYNTLKLLNGYRVRRDGPKVALAG